MTPTPITRSEWLKAVEAAEEVGRESDPSLVSVQDFMAMMGCHRNSAIRQLRLLVSSGMATVGEKWVRTPDNRMRRVPAYRLKKTAPAAKKRR